MMMKRIFIKDDLISKLFKNAGALLSGNVIASVIGLLTLAITARTLGPELFGVLIIIQTYVLVVDGMMNFQSWQAMIKFGTDFHLKNDHSRFKAVTKFILLVDILTAILAMIISIVLIDVIASYINIDESEYIYVHVFSLAILFHISGMPTAVLRIFNKFKLFAFQSIITSLIKLLSVLVLSWTETGLLGFVIVWAITDVIGNLILLYYGFRQLKREKYNNILNSKISTIRGMLKEVWVFILTTNLNSSIRMTTRQLDLLIIGSMLGNNAVGLYKIAKQFSSILSKISDPLYQVIYPQLTKLYNQQRLVEFKRLMLRSSIIVSVPVILIWFVFLIFGDFVIKVTVGEAFIEAKSIVMWYMLAIVVSVITFSLQPAMLAQGYPKSSFWVHLISTAVYFSLLFPSIIYFDIDGAGISYLIYYLLWSCIMLMLISRKLKLSQSKI